MTDNLFQPYKIISQSGSSLQLQAGSHLKIIRFAFLAGPTILFVLAIVLFFTQKDPVFLYALGGMGLLEIFIFSFIKTPGNVQLDRMGFELEIVSIIKKKRIDYLWSDVEYIRQHIIKNGKGNPLTYQAVLKSGKKVAFLSFPNSHTKKGSIEAINAALHQISNKEVLANR